MYNLLKGLKPYLKRQEIVIDGPVFRIHSTFTTVLLAVYSMIITWTQFVGQPIKCLASKAVAKNVINTYCWIMSTFLMPDGFGRPYGQIAHPGVSNDLGDNTPRKYYTYYQWVCFVLFFQALLCYFPKWIWQSWERNLMFTIVCGLNTGLRTEQEKNQKKGILLDYLVRHLNKHNMYVYRYWCCELMCFVNILMQMLLMNWFFDGDFMNYGLKVVAFDDEDQSNRIDHMIYVFPRVTKCIFRKYGPGASIEKHDAICLLPLNIVNEKTYIFICPAFRFRLMHAHNKMVSEEAALLLSRRLSMGDWWILHMLGQNMDPQVFKEVISQFAEKVDTMGK
ncbi:Innexin inx1 [Orchesella cincta]|uniref:Innexin n=1 Tax=Orchesella cincta TaxID=48709 RepID=A0A1D2M8K9_ORCCI|nr:Innexin inx1 [Orchesella cincta]